LCTPDDPNFDENF
jgi:hypothetical protein